MGVIQGSINSLIGTASRAVMAVKGYNARKQKQAAATKKAQEKQAAATKKAQEKQPAVVSPAVTTASPQQMAADRAKQSAANAVQARRMQRRNFMEYLAKQPSSVGTVGDLPEATQKQIAKQYTYSQRRRLMDAADKEASDGKHKQRNG